MTLGCWRTFTRSQSFQGDFTSSRRTRSPKAMSISSTFAKGKLSFLCAHCIITFWFIFYVYYPCLFSLFVADCLFYSHLSRYCLLRLYSSQLHVHPLLSLFQNEQIWLLQRGLWTSRTPQTAGLSNSARKAHPWQAYPNHSPHRVWSLGPLLRQLGLRRGHPRRCRRCI